MMKVSVAVITYNQQDTIAQALDSILCQKGDFSLEVIIGEDCSNDGTLAVCQEYAKRYPEVVRLLSGPQNLGIMANFARTIKACSGDFIAILAGDDYWCDELKLQKQLHYMQMHPEYGVVCTDGYRLMVSTGELLDGLPPREPMSDGDIRMFYHDRYGGVYAMPLTLLIRSELMRFIDWDEFIRRGFPVEDYPMQSVLAHHTRFGYIPDKTVVYRVSGQSATFISYGHPRYMAYHRGLVDIRQYLNGLYPDDVPFTEEWAVDYVFYKEFLQILHTGNLEDARRLVRQAPNIIHETCHFKLARKATHTRLGYSCFRVYKKQQEKKDINQRTR